MKKLFVLMLGMVIIMASMVIGISAADDGWSFASNELWEVEVSLNELPNVIEARVYPTDTAVSSVIMGNYCKSWDEGFDLRLASGGIPTLILNAAKGANTLTVSFSDAVVNANEWVDIKVEYDAENYAAYCYLNGSLKSTVDLTGKTLPTVSPDYNIVIGGNRVINANGTHNEAYFRGYIESAAAYADGEALFAYDFGGEGNTDSLMKDQSGKGNDAIRSDIWLTSSGIENSGEEYAYRFAVVGDPQTISEADVKNSYLNMYKWIAEENPDFVMTLGDIIQNGASSETASASGEWAVAIEALGYLDKAGIPHSDVKGNHCTRTQYNKYITYEKYSNAFEAQGVATLCYVESMLNSAYLFEVSGVKYLIFALEYGPSEAVLGWAGRLCEIYSDYNVIVTTHSYLGRDGTTLSSSDGGDAIEGGGYTTGEEDWNWFIDKYSNIVLVISGHISHDNVVVTQRENSCGTLVTEMLIDFQDVDGKIAKNVGMVNMFNFTEDGKTVYIETYSTSNSSYYKDINQIKLTLDTVDPENDYAPAYGEKSAEGVVSGYNYALYGETLVISGKGSGTLSGNAPSELASAVKTVVIENDTAINTIGASFFEGYSAVETFVIPETLKNIGSKALSGMSALKTVAYFNDYYSASFGGEGIIDISKVFYLANDSLYGSAASAGTVYLSRYAEISGDAKALISNSDAVYYTYPSGNAAQYMRSLGNAVNHSYYTVEMTGDANLALSGTAYMNGPKGTTSTLNWSFNIDTKTVSVTQGNCNSLRMHAEGSEFDNWKAVWVDLIEILKVGGATYSQFESYESANSISYGLTNLKSVIFSQKLDIDDREPLTGWFENCTSLVSMSGGGALASDEGIIDLTWWRKIRNDKLDRMFKNCTSIKGVIFPETMTYQNTSLTFRIWKSMFEGCTSLESITVPSYAVSIEANAFKNCTSLKSIHIPATVTSVDPTAFDGCEGLAITVESLDVYNALNDKGLDVSIDLRSASLADITAATEEISGAVKVYLATGTEENDEVYTAEALNAVFAGIDEVTYYVYPTSSGATAVREIMKNNSSVKLMYYSVEFYSNLSRSGAQGTGYTWAFDENTGVLTFSCNGSYEFVINSKNTEFLTWKDIWRDAIVKIQVSGKSQWGKMQINNDKEGFFEYLPNLEAVLMNSGINQWQVNVGSLFEGCSSLTTVDFGTSWNNVEYGVIDLSGATNIGSAAYLANMFNGCSSITSVKFPTANVASTHIGENMFKDCTSLVAITLPATVTNISSGAFDGCTNLKTITLEGETVPADLSGIPDKEGLRVICKTAEIAESVSAAGGFTLTKVITVSGEFGEATEMKGFSIRLKDYNGLRGMFSFDTAQNTINEAAGYTLVEYGAIAMSESAYNRVGGPELTLKNGTYTVNTGIKVRVYSPTEGFTDDNGDKTLYSVDGNSVNYNVAIVKYSANHASNVYMCAYSIYVSPTGEELVTFSHYSDDYKFFNLYDITLEMYKAGAVNASVSDDAAVWNTLLTGAVTVESGETYAEIPAVGQSNSGYVPSSNVNITIVIDTDDTNYVAIYRGEGAIPSQWDGYEGSNYGGTSMNQLGSSFVNCSPASGYSAVPVLTEAEYSAIKMIIMDHGITAIGRYSFVGLDHPTTYVYPTTLESIGNGAFLYNAGLTTAYMAHVDDPNKENEIGLVDFSGASTVDLADGTFRYASSITKVHLPANVTNFESTHIFGVTKWYCKMKLTKLWFGDNKEPENGVVDLSNISISAVASNAFRSASSITTLILPDGCETIAANAFYGSGGSSESSTVMKNFATIKQSSYHAGIAEFCAANGLSYIDYDGGELKAPEN